MSTPGRETRSFGQIDALLLLMAAMWGANFSIIKVALADFSPLVFSSARFLLIVPMMLLVARVTGESLRSPVSTGSRSSGWGCKQYQSRHRTTAEPRRKPLPQGPFPRE